MMKTCFISFCMLVFSLPLAASGKVINVSTNGDDVNGDGSVSKPYASLARAIESSKKSPCKLNEIVFADGTYRFAEPVTIDATSQVACIRAENPGKVILSGAVEILDWKVDSKDSRFLVAEFPFEIDSNASYSLVINGVNAKMALFPSEEKQALPYFATAADIPLDNRNIIRYDKKALPLQDMFKDLDLASVRLIVPQEWAKNRPYIATNDWKNGVFYLKGRTNMPIGRFNQGYRVQNSKQGMTEAGTWMYEGSTATIRYWPRKGETDKNLKASISRAFRIITVSKVKNLRICNLVFEGCSVVPGCGAYGKKGPAAVIGGGNPEGLVIENCEIRNTSGSGILVTKPKNTAVRNCKIYEVGGHGVHYYGGGNGGGVYNCEIFNVGSSGAYLQLSNVTLKDCHIHHTGRSAATLWTTGGQVISNEFNHTMLSSRDGGAIYGAMNNSIFEGNYCHDCGDWPGLYNDEGGKETVYRGNRFVNCWWPFHMHQTRDIVITNNTMECDKPMRFSFQGSANAVFRDNVIRTENEITEDKYLDHCRVWENYVELGSSTKGWGKRKLVTFKKAVKPLKEPMTAFPTKGEVFSKDGKFMPALFVTPWKASRSLDRDASGRHAPGVPGSWFSVGYDAENLYIKASYKYNQFVKYPGCTTIGSGNWGEWDGLKFFFKDLEITVFIDGTVLSSDPSLKFDATNSSVKNHGGCGAKGYTVFLAIPLKRFGLEGMTVDALVGKTINFEAVFYNAQYKETRYYEGPSKGCNLPGTIHLGEHQP